MIEYIKGILIDKKPTSAIIQSGGVAYYIHITLPAYEILPEVNTEVKLITYLHVRENPINFTLLGFSDINERECFRHLISVSGIGHKTAMSILSAINYSELIQIITSGNYIPLTGIQGVGKKTAERLALELKDKFTKSESFSVSSLKSLKTPETEKLSEVISALLALGYNRIESEKMISKLEARKKITELTVEEAIKEVLKSG
jgi:Holliday junction DNA helicase RuvA